LLGEPQRAEVTYLAFYFRPERKKIDALIAAFEAELGPRCGELVKNELTHRNFIKI
jgi:hypothetical protein